MYCTVVFLYFGSPFSICLFANYRYNEIGNYSLQFHKHRHAMHINRPATRIVIHPAITSAPSLISYIHRCMVFSTWVIDKVSTKYFPHKTSYRRVCIRNKRRHFCNIQIFLKESAI